MTFDLRETFDDDRDRGGSAGSSEALEAVSRSRAPGAPLPPPRPHEHPSDAAIRAALAERRYEHAFELIRRAHGRAMHGLARRIVGERATAEDVVQDALLRIHLGLAAMRGSSPRSWVMSVTAHVALDEVRRRARRRRLGPLDDSFDHADDRPDPRAALEQAQRGHVLASSVARLAPRIRASVLLHFGHELTFEAIAPLVGDETGGAVRIRVVRALDRLRGRLIHAGVR